MALSTLIFVPGAWHSPVVFDRLISVLEPHGYKCLAIRLPSWDPDSENCHTTHEPDIAAIRTAIMSELDAGESNHLFRLLPPFLVLYSFLFRSPNNLLLISFKTCPCVILPSNRHQHQSLNTGHNVILVTHSAGAVVGCSALRGLNAKSRSAAGHETSVIAITMLCSMVVPEGVSLFDALGHKPAPIHDIRGPVVHIADVQSTQVASEVYSANDQYKGPAHAFYNDLPVSEQEHYVSLLRPMAWATTTSPLTYAAYLYIPTSYLMCTLDNALPLPYQQGIIKMVRDMGGDIRVEVVESGHSPFLSMPERTAEFVRRAAGENLPVGMETGGAFGEEVEHGRR